MKKILKFTLVAAFIFACSGTSFGQKMGYINMQDLVTAMPERDSVMSRLERLSRDFQEQLEAIQVEYNNKLQEYSKNSATMNEAVKQIKEKELNDIRTRYEESQQALNQSFQKSQDDFMEPVIQKATEAVKKVSKANNIPVVFNTIAGALAYYDESTLTNMLPLVKKELGLK